MNKAKTENLIKELIEKITNVIKISADENMPVSLDPAKTTWFSVEVSQPHFFWERGGEAIFALNHIVRKIIETQSPKTDPSLSEEGLGILIDVNGFQKKRIESIHAIAHMMAERARYFKSNIEIDPMPSFERRIVHEFLANATDLKTESQGEGLSRRVIIKYTGAI